MLNAEEVLETPGTFTRQFPSFALGTSSFSIEVWIKYLYFDTWNAATPRSGIGFWGDRGTTTPPPPVAAMEFGPSPIVHALIDTQSVVSSAALTVPRGWHHWTMNFKATGTTSTVYLDGVLQATLAIANFPWGGADSTYSFGPLVGVNGGSGAANPGACEFDLAASTDPGGTNPESLTDDFTNFGFPHVPVIIGPIAVHFAGSSPSPILTVAQMADSMARRDVQELNSSGGRDVIYRWRNIGFDDGISWDREPRHGLRGITDLVGVPIGIPRGADGTVRVNTEATLSPGAVGDNTFSLQTVATYGQERDSSAIVVADGMRGWAVFGTDPFFSQGGGVPPGL